jgi:signal transduction histidine kinase
LGRLVDDLLDFSAIESGVMRLQRDWCDLQLVIEAAIGCLPDAQGDAVSVHCEAGLPVVWADHDRLEQVFVNLVGNALRHNPSGTQVTVSVRALAADPAEAFAAWGGEGPTPGEVEIDVVDDGRGMPPELAAAPFESDRGHRSTNAGAGLGLSIARGIVAAHGGRIGLLEATTGTAFRIRLPVEASGRAAPEADPRESLDGELTAALADAAAPRKLARSPRA